jgi:hypothetical protein
MMICPTAKTIPVVLLVCLLALASCGDDGSSRPPSNDFYAEQEFSIDIDVDGEESFRVEGISGSIEIAGAQGTDQVQVTGVRRVESDTQEDADARLVGLTVKNTTDGTYILVKTNQPGNTEGRNYIVNYTVTVPNYLKVVVTSGAGEVTVQSVQNGVTVSNAVGPVSVTDIYGGLNLSAAAGSIDASVTMPLGENVLITTGTGDIELEIPQDTSARVSATAGVGSIVVSNLTIIGRVDEGNSITGTIGKGNGSITLVTSVGNITLTGMEAADQSVRFPLDDYVIWQRFGDVNRSFQNRHHCAEDAYGEGGTPVYAIADGVISYSGPMSGYGWLIIVDHPPLGVYSLYGHLSTKLSKSVDGAVKKGDCIAYLAYDDEDGSGGDYPDWGPHLHFGIRSGAKADYPSSSGDDRWMAGYTYDYPTNLGWLHPTEFILDHSN